MAKPTADKSVLMQYFSFAWQMIAGLGLAVYSGILADRGLHTTMPLLVWILPLLVIVGMIIKVIKDTSKKSK